MIRSNHAGLIALLCATALTTFGAAQAHAAEGLESVQVGVHGGTLGVGVNASLEITEKFAARALFSTWGLDYEETESGNEFHGDLDLQTIGLAADWHPFAGGFRVTGGVFLNSNEVSATAMGEDLELGDNTYDDGRFDLLLDFERIAPYLGVGWTSGPIAGSNFSILADAGLLYQRSPRVSASGTADGCPFTLSRDGVATVGECSGSASRTLRPDLESEHMELSDDLEDFRWYPVLSIGVSYRF